MVEDSNETKSGEKEINNDTFQVLDKAFRGMTFSFDQDDQPRQAIAAEPASSKEPQVLKQFTDVQKSLLEEAKGAMERLHSGSMRMISKCSQAKDKESFKPHMLAMKAWMDRDDHLLLWTVIAPSPLHPSRSICVSIPKRLLPLTRSARNSKLSSRPGKSCDVIPSHAYHMLFHMKKNVLSNILGTRYHARLSVVF